MPNRRNREQRDPAPGAQLQAPPAPPHDHIFLLWPNIIGYLRIILAITSLYYMPIHPRRCSVIYSLSCLLDALDGYLARYLNQSSKFGAVLDMVTDRCATACLLVFLASAWPRWAMVFQALICLDFASHYVHMYASMVLGKEGSHKVVEKERSWLLNLYYSNKIVLFLLCTFNEVFFIALYLLAFTSPIESQSLPDIAGVISNNPGSAGAFEMARANKLDPTWPYQIAGVSFLGMLIKQFINILQLVKASRWIAESDIERRRKTGGKWE